MKMTSLVDAVLELEADQLGVVFTALVQRLGVLGDDGLEELTEYVGGLPEDGDFTDGLALLDTFVSP